MKAFEDTANIETMLDGADLSSIMQRYKKELALIGQ